MHSLLRISSTFLLALVSLPVAAEVIDGELRIGSLAFEGHYFSAYKLQVPAEGQAAIELKPRSFNGALILIDPFGEVFSDIDFRPDIVTWDENFDVGLAFPPGRAGEWIAIATTNLPFSGGRYSLHTEGLDEIVPVDRTQLDYTLLRSAFAHRSPRQTEQMSEVEVGLIVEALEDEGLRDQISATLNEALRESKSSADAFFDMLQNADLRIAALDRASEVVAELDDESRETLLSLVENELQKEQNTINLASMHAVRASAMRESVSLALEHLEAIRDVTAQFPELSEGSSWMGRTSMQGLNSEQAAAIADLAINQHEVADILATSGLQRELAILPEGRLVASMGGVSYTSHIQFSPMQSRDSAFLSRLGAANPHFPTLFPWPPPDASARTQISRRFLGDEPPQTLGEVADQLAAALREGGYDGPSYLGLPGGHGFAMVTRIEQTDYRGRPLDGEARWSIRIRPLKRFSLPSYLTALLTAEPGYFRVLVMIVSNQRFQLDDARGRLATLEKWSGLGLDGLPAEVRSELFSSDFAITALVYEFEKASHYSNPEVVTPGRNRARSHLAHTRFVNYLN